MIKLSFIVPVYNVAHYLRNCVESLINQDYSDYEIILVDDGSTDESSKICDEYARANDEMSCDKSLNEPLALNDWKPQIKVIHQENGGLSAARNAGLRAAKGEYVCFVDSDDYWEENVLGRLMEQVEREKLDVLRFDYQNVNERHEVFEPNKTPRFIDTCNEVVDGETYLNTRMSYACYAVMFIIRRAMMPTFMDGILFEDTEWTPRMLIAAKRVNATTTVVYNYLTRQGSITTNYNKEHVRKKMDSLLRVNLSLQRLLFQVHDARWINGCMADNTYCIFNNAAEYDYDSVQYWIRVVQKQKMLPLRGYKVRKITMLRYRIINLSPRLYCWLRHLRMTYLKK